MTTAPGATRSGATARVVAIRASSAMIRRTSSSGTGGQAPPDRGDGDRAVHGPGIHVLEAEAPGDLASHRALARPHRPVDRHGKTRARLGHGATDSVRDPAAPTPYGRRATRRAVSIVRDPSVSGPSA